MIYKVTKAALSFYLLIVGGAASGLGDSKSPKYNSSPRCAYNDLCTTNGPFSFKSGELDDCRWIKGTNQFFIKGVLRSMLKLENNDKLVDSAYVAAKSVCAGKEGPISKDAYAAGVHYGWEAGTLFLGKDIPRDHRQANEQKAFGT